MKNISFYFLISCLGFVSCSEKTVSWQVAQRQDGVLILEDQDSVLFYQRTTKSLNGKYHRANYIHPLYGLDNNRLTEDFPADHLHHRGIFWAWHQNYIGEESVGDAWALEDFSWYVADVQVDQKTDACVLQTEVYWLSPLWTDERGAPKPFVEERATVSIHPAEENYRIIDFRIELESLVDNFSIGGSEDEKGYSGFSWRIPLPEDVSFTGAEGPVTPQNLALDAGPWIDIRGNLDGRPGQEGVLVIDDPGNPGHPQSWILRSARSMQNAAYPGREKVLIPKDDPLVLQYRMVVYKGDVDPAVFNSTKP